MYEIWTLQEYYEEVYDKKIFLIELIPAAVVYAVAKPFEEALQSDGVPVGHGTAAKRFAKLACEELENLYEANGLSGDYYDLEGTKETVRDYTDLAYYGQFEQFDNWSPEHPGFKYY